MKIQIKSHSGAVLFEADCANLREAVVAAVKSRADLSGADLSRAYLSGADLHGAYLSRAYLSGAYLSGADLSRAYLSGADLHGADLSGAKIKDAVLHGDSPIVQIGPIGSRSSTLTVFRTDKGLRLQTGCFYGDADTFLASVMDTHGTNRHATNYHNALKLVTGMLEETP